MSCRDFEVLLSLRATGALDAHETARVEGHLAVCASCAADAKDTAAALALTSLPEPTEAERRVYRDLPARTLEALRRRGERRASAKKYAAAFFAVAAAAAFAVAPALLRRPAEAPVEAASWQAPDLDGIWEDTQVLDLEAAVAAAEGEEPDAAALAAVDF